MASEVASECPICYADALSRPQALTPCGHKFCRPCIDSALDDGGLGLCPICRAFIAASSLDASAAFEQLWGCTFVPCSDEPGMVAFHFPAEGMDYAHIRYAGEKRPFVEASFDQEEQLFRGTVDWSPASWQGAQRREYVMYFAPGFATIARGEIMAFDGAGALVATERLGAELRYANRDIREVADAPGRSGAAGALLGEESAAELRQWIAESNPTLGDVLERLRGLGFGGAAGGAQRAPSPPPSPPSSLEPASFACVRCDVGCSF